MKTVTIPGGTANIRERSDLKVRQRRMMESATLIAGAAMAKLPNDITPDTDPTTIRLEDIPALTQSDVNSLTNIQDATIVALLDSWTLTGPDGVPLPLPTFETIGDMDLDLYDALAEATKAEGAAAISGAIMEVSPDPKALITSSDSLNGTSKDEVSNLPSSMSSPGGESPSTASVSPA